MQIQSIDMSDFSLVYIDKKTNTPYCKKHGAMNKMTLHEDGGGIWRCISIVGIQKIQNGNSISKKEIEGICRAGCEQTNNPLFNRILNFLRINIH